MIKKILLVLFPAMIFVILPAASQTNDNNNQQDTVITDIEQETGIPFATISPDELEADSESYDISSLLQGSRDVYVSTAGFNFGNARFRLRGYDGENTIVMINDVPVNSPEIGRAFYSVWGGLNDATRMTVQHHGIGVSREHFGFVGGANNITTRASEYGPNTRITYSLTNRAYTHRAMALHSTGLMDNGWAFTLSGSSRLAQEGYVEGTFYENYAYFLSAEKQINNNHSIGLIGFASPSRRGSPGVATQEAYDLAGSNFYNPNWGYQDGEKRNARVSNYNQPMVILSHYWDITENTELTTSLSYSFGQGGRTSLNWYDAPDPRPDYYRYLPSFYRNDQNLFDSYTRKWEDEEFRQLRWDDFYNANYKNLFTQSNIGGYGDDGETATGMRSKYVLEDRRNDHAKMGYTTNFNSFMGDHLVLSGGLNFYWHEGYHFKEMADLLGGDWWVDVDQFAERDFDDPQMAQNDLNNPNRLITEGDRFGYDYTANVHNYEGFMQAEFTYPRYDFFIAGMLSHNTFWRTGHMKNGRFPDNSYGEGEKHSFFDFGAKGGFTWKITGRHYLTTNMAYMTRAPFFRNAYISPRVRDGVIENLTSEKIMSGDINYIVRTPTIKSRFTVFYTDFSDQTWSRSFYHDEMRTFVNYIMTDIDKRHIGAELGVDLTLSSTLSMHIVGGLGDYIYTSRPNVTIAQDNDAEIIEERTVYFENYKIGGMTHNAASIGFRYNSPRYWFAGITGNYFNGIYLDTNPDRRTQEAVDGYYVTDPQWNQLLDQTVLEDSYTIDVFAGRSWRLAAGTFLNVSLSVDNVLNNTEFAMGGFEQLRYDSQDIDRFPPKYFYLYGRNFFLNIVLRM